MVPLALVLTAYGVAHGAASAPPFARDGLVLSWEAREAHAGALADGSGQGNTGKLVGSAAFADEPARIELGGKGALVGAAPLRPERASIEVVFRADRTRGPLQHIVTTFAHAAKTPAPGNPRQWVMEIRGHPPHPADPLAGHLTFGVFGEDQSWHLALSSVRLRKGWHHALGTFDGHSVRLYLDGRLQRRSLPHQSPDYEGRIHRPPDDAIRLPAAGSSSPTGQWGLEGAVALVRVYSRALSSEEVAQNFRCAQTLVPALAEKGAQGMARRPKPPFRVIFSNDTTNTLTCTSSYHKKGEPFRAEMLEGTVDEVPGVDVHMLQPGLGWIPWWKSKVYPADEHYRRFEQRTGLKADPYGQYMLAGGDMVKVFVERCRAKGQVPFVSLRLNDSHLLEYVGQKHARAAYVSRFYEEHPEYRLDPKSKGWDQRVLNWAVPEVREHKLAFIREICESYNIDGFELDFMRHCNLFRLHETTGEQRAEIVAGFVRRVREILDRTAKPGQRRWLCARVPCLTAPHDALGIDLPAMAEAGLDVVNLSAYYFTQQQTDLPLIRELVPDAAIYLEMTHCTTVGPGRGGYDDFSFRRTTDEQFYTGAHLAYRRGGDGVSLFNFVYYREHGTPGRGPFNEPPFHVLKRLGDPEWLARQPQWYVLAEVWNQPAVPDRPMPRPLRKGQPHTFVLDMAPTEHQRKDGLLRLMTAQDASGCTWTVRMNGTELKPTGFVRKPIDHPYEACLGEPNQYACFTCPRATVKDGPNQLAVTLDDGAAVTVHYIDLVLP